MRKIPQIPLEAADRAVDVMRWLDESVQILTIPQEAERGDHAQPEPAKRDGE